MSLKQGMTNKRGDKSTPDQIHFISIIKSLLDAFAHGNLFDEIQFNNKC